MTTKLFITALMLLSISATYSQTLHKNPLDDADTIVLKIGSTPDILYIGKEKYLIDRSFLSVINGYKNLYPNLCSTEIFFPVKTQGEINGEKFKVEWLLKDNTLCLRNIHFYDVCTQNLYGIMEEFTGCKFQKSTDASSIGLTPQESSRGSMKATWAEGVFYVKKARIYPKETLQDWINSPYRKLTFKAGKLLSNQEIIPKQIVIPEEIIIPPKRATRKPPIMYP